MAVVSIPCTCEEALVPFVQLLVCPPGHANVCQTSLLNVLSLPFYN